MMSPNHGTVLLGRLAGELAKAMATGPDSEGRQRASAALDKLIERCDDATRTTGAVNKAATAPTLPGAGEGTDPNFVMESAAEQLRIVLAYSADPGERDRATDALNRMARGWFANARPVDWTRGSTGT